MRVQLAQIWHTVLEVMLENDCKSLILLARPERETLNSLFATLEQWNDYLKAEDFNFDDLPKIKTKTDIETQKPPKVSGPKLRGPSL